MAESAELLYGNPDAEIEAFGAPRALRRRLAVVALCMGASVAGLAAVSAWPARPDAAPRAARHRSLVGEERVAVTSNFSVIAAAAVSEDDASSEKGGKGKKAKKHFIPPWAQPCGGPCADVGYTCVQKADKSCSQCIDCSDAGNYKFDCAAYDNELRLAAVEQCGASCDLAPPVTGCVLGEFMRSDYSSEECDDQPDRSVRLRCRSKERESCGSRLSSHGHTGKGVYEVTMQGAYGEGIVTTFYLDTFGRLTSDKILWNEVKFEIWGSKCYDDESRILTSYRVAGSNRTYDKVVTVDFDACDDWHTYTIALGSNVLGWKIDGEVVRREDMSDCDDFLRDVEGDGFEVHAAMWGQDDDKTHDEGIGYMEMNDEDFPLYAWFANVRMPDLDEGSRAPYQWVFDPSAHVR